jgi:hypothetical protein
MSRDLLRPSLAGGLPSLPNSDSEAAEQLELSSEDDHTAAEDNIVSPSSAHPDDIAATSSPSGADDADAEEEADASESQHVAAAGSSVQAGSSLDDGVSYASLLWDNTRAVVEQADESRNSMKKMVSCTPTTGCSCSARCSSGAVLTC